MPFEPKPTPSLAPDMHRQVKKHHRLMMIPGTDGTIACRLHKAETAKLLPQWKERAFEFLSRSYLRLKNLDAIRGRTTGSRMLGPGDYYGNVEKLHEHAFTIEIESGVPCFTPRPLSEIKPNVTLTKLNDAVIKRVDVNWISGTEKTAIKAASTRHSEKSDTPLFGNSVFPHPGVLEVFGDETVALPTFDAVNVDLSSFKVRLVKNDTPFQITTEVLDAKNDFRAVSYLFEQDYAKNCVEEGGGLFLETHDFVQTMTPVDKKAGGFITLGRWGADGKDGGKLELIALKIPYGYTLIVEKNCIHGDSTFIGTYMMAMTSDHVKMGTADTVFPKSERTGQNISFVADYNVEEEYVDESTLAPKPLFLPVKPSTDERRAFKKETANNSFVLQPFNKTSQLTTYDRLFHTKTPGEPGADPLRGKCMVM